MSGFGLSIPVPVLGLTGIAELGKVFELGREQSWARCERGPRAVEGQAAPGLGEKLLEELGCSCRLCTHPTPLRDRHCTKASSSHTHPVLRCWLLPKNPQERLLLEKISMKHRPGGTVNSESVIVNRMFLEKMPHTGQVKRTGRVQNCSSQPLIFIFLCCSHFSLIFLFFIYLISFLVLYIFGSLLSRKHLAAHNIWSPPGSCLQLPGDPYPGCLS